MQKYKNSSDEELVVLTREKNQELFILLAKRYESKLLRYAKYLGASRDEAADIVQNAFVKAFKNLNNFKAQKKFSSWIYRITHNEAINLFKKESHKNMFSLSDFLSEILPSGENIEEDYEDQEIKKDLEQNLKKLDLKYKEVLVLHFL